MLSLTEDMRPLRDDETDGYFFVEELGVFAHDMFALLVKEIREELADPTFQKYRHGRCATNNRGCSGPMCRWARRVWRDSNAATRAKLEGRKYRPRPSLEKQLTDELCRTFDQYLDREWLGRKVKQEIEKVVGSEARPDEEPLENLQAPEPLASRVQMTGLLFVELV